MINHENISISLNTCFEKKYGKNLIIASCRYQLINILIIALGNYLIDQLFLRTKYKLSPRCTSNKFY